MKNILFIEPKGVGSFYKNPMHLQYLAGAVKKNLDVSVNLLDLNIDDDVKQFEQVDSNLIVISTPSNSIASIENIVKKYSKSSFVLVGEIVTDGLSAEFLTLFSGVDIISIPSYGEVKLINHIKNLYELNSNNDNIDSSPVALFTKQIVNKYIDSGFQIFMHGISRGCEEKCTFCRLNNRKETSGVVNNINYLSTVDAISNILELSSDNIYVQFSDENFFGGKSLSDKKQRLKSIYEFSKYMASTSKFNRITFGIDTRIDTIYNIGDTNELSVLRYKAWDKFISSGLKYVYIGLESVSKSQIKRYGKKITNDEIVNSIHHLNKINIDYTLGLIIFDPLTTVKEVKENINFIKSNDLYANVASLLKEIRIQVKSPYYRLMKVKTYQNDTVSNYLYCNQNSIEFVDNTIQSIMPIIREVSLLFRGSGYRHSDVSRIYNLTNNNSMLNKIPSLVIKLEIEIIEILTSGKYNFTDNVKLVNNEISKCTKCIHDILLKFDEKTLSEGKVYRYYLSVFNLIESKIPIIPSNNDHA